MIPMLLIALLGPIHARPDGDDPAPAASPRVVRGRIVDAEGRPPLRGRVQVGPGDPAVPFPVAWTAPLDADGRFRIELRPVEDRGEPVPTGGPLRYLILAPGARPEAGRIDAGGGPDTLDVTLAPQPWKETEIVARDGRGAPVEGAEVLLKIMGDDPWQRLRTDADGRCVLASPPDLFFGAAVRKEGFRASSFAFRGAADDPARVTVPLRPPIRGRVVDPDGRPLAGIRVGRLISVSHGDDEGETVVYPMPGSEDPALTDADGRFALAPALSLDSRSMSGPGEFRIYRQPLAFADASFDRVALLSFDQSDPSPMLEVTLGRARPVRIPIEHAVTPPSGGLEGWWELNIPVERSRTYVMGGDVTPAEGGDRVESRWPPGRYTLEVHSADPAAGKGTEATTVEIEVPPGEGPVELPPIRMDPLPQEEMAGRSAPEIDARDLATGEPTRLADLRGKVVVLDFWGYWCGPCVGAMPRLMEVHRRFEGRPVAILALHDQSIQDRDEYDRKLAGVRRDLWGGRDLPFVVALDRPDPGLADGENPIGRGVTVGRYGVTLFPTTYLIDPAGEVVGTVDPREPGALEAAIERLLKRRPPR